MENTLSRAKTKVEAEVQENIKATAAKYHVIKEVSAANCVLNIPLY